MKFLFDFFPILLFFIAYKVFDIYVATAVTIVASLVQVVAVHPHAAGLDSTHEGLALVDVARPDAGAEP